MKGQFILIVCLTCLVLRDLPETPWGKFRKYVWCQKILPKFYKGDLWEFFFLLFLSVWDKLVIVPSFLWYIILSYSNEIRPMWRYFNIDLHVYLKFLISGTFPQNKIIKISPCRSDLLSIRNEYLQSNIWYNYQFVPDTLKIKNKIVQRSPL